MSDREPTIIGRAEEIYFPKLDVGPVPARVDTGARTSAVWASNIVEKDGVLEYELFAKGSEFYTGQRLKTTEYAQRLVANSTGQVEQRYTVKLLASVHGRKINLTFTLANRSKQAYPILLGRNLLRGKFIVNVKLGTPFVKAEKLREIQKQAVFKRLGKQKDIS